VRASGLKGSGDSLFHNGGDGTFTDVSKKAGVEDPDGFYGLTTVWSDFNNTGRPDIYMANDSGYLYRNNGNGKFTDIGMESGTALGEDGHEQAGMGVAVGDYLHTGRPSLAVTTFSMDNTPLYRNDVGQADVRRAAQAGLETFRSASRKFLYTTNRGERYGHTSTGCDGRDDFPQDERACRPKDLRISG
jgi:FG-GAP-like repeat